ncbi:MAG TPA: multicopper oxidase domain-containing protein [Crinalium sp.]
MLEFAYRYPGKFMFHPHKDDIAEAGCMGLFEVVDRTASNSLSDTTEAHTM